MMRHSSIAALALALTATPALAQMGAWDRGSSWGSRDRGDGWGREDDWSSQRISRNSGEKEGKVVVSTFRAEDAQGLGQGAIAATHNADWAGSDTRHTAVYEAAVLDALGRRGYAISGPAPDADSLVELRITREVAVPEEAPRRPVSGSMSVGTGTYGSGMGLGLHIDLSKPKKAMIATRLEARIRSKATGALLWEGRADIRTREDSRRWDDQAIAASLSDALFARFPEGTG